MVIKLKKGGDIHIKEKNKGKFTSYCGGNVTSACIAKAKASGNPTLVKRATFADNARKWKHLNGGSIEKFLAGKQIIIPKKRTVLRTIPLSNGSKLTAEQDTTGLIRGIFWFRDNKYITPLQLKKYKFYDSNIKGYRQLNSFTNMDEKGKLTVSTPLYAPNLEWLSKTSDAESRYKLASKLLIPFKGLKIITLKTKGNMNLADVPVNMLDSIAVNAGRSNTDFWTSAALVGKESTFGGMSKALHGDNEVLYGMEDGKFNPGTLTNNHSYFSSPETDYWSALFNKYLKGVTGSDDEERLKAEADVKYAREHGQIVLKTPQYSLYVLADAFKRYNVAPNKYNPGLKNYASMVNGIKLELQGDKLLQEYWNTRGKLQYARGRKEGMKQGGKFRKFQIGGYVQPSNVLEAINNGSAAGGLLEGFGRVMSKILPKWMLKAGTYLSPLNYAAALSKGSINPKVGEEVISKWHPNLLLAARTGEIILGGKAVKGAGKTAVNTAAKAGNKTARAYLISKELNNGIKLNTKNGRIEVTNTYFNSPDKWYRITETPEKYGIIELGKNVTTHDAPQTHGTINGWRSSMLKAPITKSSEGFIKRPQKIEIGIRRKNGQAHGNTSQAAKGKLWGGTTSGSNLFPEGVIEGQAPSMINYGIDRTNFVMTPWELVPNGGRVGFHTGEMPMSNLGWFLKTKNGTYTYEPIIPDKRIQTETPKITKSKPYVRWSQEGYLNEAYDIDGGPGLKFQVVKDVDNPKKGVLQTKGNGEYSLHFKSSRNNPNKEGMFLMLAESIPEGGIVSTWGKISKGGYHGINRFGELFGWTKVGERPAVNGPVNMFLKPELLSMMKSQFILKELEEAVRKGITKSEPVIKIETPSPINNLSRKPLSILYILDHADESVPYSKVKPIVDSYDKLAKFLNSPAYIKRLENYYKDKGSMLSTLKNKPLQNVSNLISNILNTKFLHTYRIDLNPNILGRYYPKEHRIVTIWDALKTTTPRHEMIHARNKGNVYLDNAKYRMRTKAEMDLNNPEIKADLEEMWNMDRDNRYYGNVLELEPRVLNTLIDMLDKGIDINNLTQEIVDKYFDRPIDEFPQDTLSLLNLYHYDDILKALQNFKGVTPYGLAGYGVYKTLSTKKLERK